MCFFFEKKSVHFTANISSKKHASFSYLKRKTLPQDFLFLFFLEIQTNQGGVAKTFQMKSKSVGVIQRDGRVMLQIKRILVSVAMVPNTNVPKKKTKSIASVQKDIFALFGKDAGSIVISFWIDARCSKRSICYGTFEKEHFYTCRLWGTCNFCSQKTVYDELHLTSCLFWTKDVCNHDCLRRGRQTHIEHCKSRGKLVK